MAEYTSKVSSSTPAETHKSSKVPPRLLRLFALYENLLRFVLPLCSKLPRPNPETPIVTSTNIVDISGVGLRQFWNLRSHMQDASVLATAHYPETLDRIFVRCSFRVCRLASIEMLTCCRLLERHPSSLRSGAGSSGGSTQSRYPRSSFFPPTKSSLR